MPQNRIGVGSGLGTGIISNGHLITGSDWYAADIGYLSINPDGPLCVCGGLGLAGFDFIGPTVREEMMRRTIPNSRGKMDIIAS